MAIFDSTASMAWRSSIEPSSLTLTRLALRLGSHSSSARDQRCGRRHRRPRTGRITERRTLIGRAENCEPGIDVSTIAGVEGRISARRPSLIARSADSAS
jgi:hypothetical protein